MSRVVRFHRTGGPEVLQIEDLPDRALKDGELRVRIEAIGLNRAEQMFRSGAYLEQPNLPAQNGYEASAVVLELGPGVSGFAVGEPVSVIPAFSLNAYGVYAEVAVVPAYAVVKRPKGLSAIEAAAVWMAYITAYGALIDVAKVGKGDAVIIPAASSSVGLAAIQIVNSVGGIAIATTRTRAKEAQLKAAGAAHVIATNEQDIVEAVNAITGGKGARVVFDPVGGPGIEKLAAAMAAGGTLVLYGLLSLQPTPFPFGPALLKGLNVRGYTLFEVVANPERREAAISFVTSGLEAGTLKPAIAKTFPFDQIVEAHRYLESNDQFGKIIVTV
ncbi:MAG: zinc-dependent alcohol dehydrogenase family protein [Hyphomicrobium sp.]|nr:zinc-dependent alcohol dehydrogenase family protein [Hyphomicrobium sp.]